MTVQEKFGFTKVINARGPATVLGAARVSDEVAQDIYDILGESAEIWELQRKASEVIADFTGAEAGCVVGCSSAGMAVSAAACLTGDDFSKIKALPDITWPKKKIVIQKGQVTGIGDCPVYQIVKMAGAEYVEIGEALDCATFHLRDALDENTAAAFYIVSDVFPPNLLPLETFIAICKEKNVPVICDAAYYTDFRALTTMGADLVVFSGQKWLGGCTSGIVAGRRDLVKACYMQEMGIGRPMKVGKEGIVSIMSSIRRWKNKDNEAIEKSQTEMAMRIYDKIKDFNGVTAYLKKTKLSPSVRLHVDIDPDVARYPAWVINADMSRMDPVIRTEDYNVNSGKIVFDMEYLKDGDETVIADVLEGYFSGRLVPKIGKDGNLGVPRTRMDLLYDVFSQWLDGNPRG